MMQEGRSLARELLRDYRRQVRRLEALLAVSLVLCAAAVAGFIRLAERQG